VKIKIIFINDFQSFTFASFKASMECGLTTSFAAETKVDLRNVVPVDSSPKTVSIVVLVFGILEAAVALIIGKKCTHFRTFDASRRCCLDLENLKKHRRTKRWPNEGRH